MSDKTAPPTIEWDFGTAYELFVSLHVLHEPDYFGLRPSWAAGIRSRIPAAERKLLEDVFPVNGVPLAWLRSLPAPKDAVSALWALKQIPAQERPIKLMGLDKPCKEDGSEEAAKHKQACEILLRIHQSGQWQNSDVDFFHKIHRTKHAIKRDSIERALDWWSRPAEFGEGYLSALESYYDAFFKEEEKRVAPILTEGLARAKELSTRLTVEELFVELSQGVQMGEDFRAKRLVIAPAFWTTPLIFLEKLDEDTMLLLFGARPAEMSIVPGETLPDGLVRSLKALADPTRLKILFYLSHESLTPSELARRLHLRAPTVTHHLNELRLASLVELSFEHEERRYAIRKQALDSTFSSLSYFLKENPES